MANRVFLFQTTSEPSSMQSRGLMELPVTQADVLAAASYLLPVLWVSLFSAADMIMVPVVDEDDDGEQVQSDEGSSYPMLAAATSVAIARSRDVASNITALVADGERYLREWNQFLGSIDKPSIGVDLMELDAMEDTDDLVKKLHAALAWVETPTAASVTRITSLTTLKVKTGRGGVQSIGSTEDLGHALRGGTWLRATPFD